jgi:hypothetical protein
MTHQKPSLLVLVPSKAAEERGDLQHFEDLKVCISNEFGVDGSRALKMVREYKRGNLFVTRKQFLALADATARTTGINQFWAVNPASPVTFDSVDEI